VVVNGCTTVSNDFCPFLFMLKFTNGLGATGTIYVTNYNKNKHKIIEIKKNILPVFLVRHFKSSVGSLKSCGHIHVYESLSNGRQAASNPQGLLSQFPNRWFLPSENQRDLLWFYEINKLNSIVQWRF